MLHSGHRHRSILQNFYLFHIWVNFYWANNSNVRNKKTTVGHLKNAFENANGLLSEDWEVVLCDSSGLASDETGYNSSTVSAEGWFFLDSDKEIENEMNLSTKDIFDKYGEKFFRNKECEIFKFYSKKKNILISSGGGSFCQKITYGIIKEYFFSIWLDVNEDILFEALIQVGLNQTTNGAKIVQPYKVN